MKDKIINVNIGKLFLEDCISTLERVIILLEDNPKIKDTSEFYTGEDVLSEVAYFHKEFKELLK